MKAILTNTEYCTGCHACEVACKHELGLAEGEWGIKLEPDKFQALKQAMETGGDMNQIVAPPELV